MRRGVRGGFTRRAAGEAAPVALLVLVLGAAPAGTLPAAAELASGGGRIKGSVTGAGRQEVVGAHVLARTLLPDRDALFLTTTDETGTYLYESLPPGRYEVRARAAGHLEGSYSGVDVQPPFRNILDFRLRPVVDDEAAAAADQAAAGEAPAGAPVSVSGRITAPGGQPVADAEIAFSGGPPPGQRLVLSTGDGRFHLPDLAPGLYTLEVTAPGAIPIRIPEVAAAPGRPLEVQVRLADFPLEMAAKRGIILPPVDPLAPRRWVEIPPAPEPQDPPPPDPPPPVE